MEARGTDGLTPVWPDTVVLKLGILSSLIIIMSFGTLVSGGAHLVKD